MPFISAFKNYNMHNLYIYSAYFMHNCKRNNKLSLITQILLTFSWCFHIFVVILQPQTYKNTSHEGKE